ncbi:hypothetical protein J3E69DRAFT_189379 [Trichoderma sp. SZMC 28015]
MFSLPPQNESLRLIMISSPMPASSSHGRPSVLHPKIPRREAQQVQGRTRPWLCLPNTIFVVASHTSKPEASSEQKHESEVFIWRAESLWEDTECSTANLESGCAILAAHGALLSRHTTAGAFVECTQSCRSNSL